MNTKTEMIKIKKAIPKDIDFIYASFKAKTEELGMLHRFTIKKSMLNKALFDDKIANVMIAYDGNQLAGLIMYSKTNRDFIVFDKPGIYVHDIYILPGFRKKGIATKLMDYIKKMARENNFGRIDFVVQKDNEPALKLYDGWKDVHEVDHIKPMRIKID